MGCFIYKMSGSKQIYFRDFFEEIEFLSVKQGNYRA